MYIGNTPAESYASFETETFSVSATTNYTLSHAVTNENEIRLVINGVVQQPGSGKAYTASGTTLTLSSATASGDVMYAVYLGRALQTVNPPNASVGSAQIADDLISGKTALGATPADTDELLISDAGTLKRVDYSHLKSANTPFFQAAMSTAAQTLSDNSAAKVAFNVATYDSGSTYDTSNYRWTPGVVGKYFVSTSVYPSADSDSEMQTTHCTFKKNGTIIHYIGNLDSRTAWYGRGKVCAGSAVIELDADDYVEVFVTVNTVSGGAARVNGETTQTWFNGFKLA